MSDLYDVPTADPAFVPDDADRAGIADWFDRYDRLAAAGDTDALADLALFPLNVVSDHPGGDGVAVQWTREQFVESMARALGSGSGDVSLRSNRTPHFLTSSLVVVVTEAQMTGGGSAPQMIRYADVLVRRGEDWAFQTMIQGGWGSALQ